MEIDCNNLSDDNLYVISNPMVSRIEGYTVHNFQPKSGINEFFIKLLHSNHELEVYEKIKNCDIAPKMLGVSNFSGGWYLILEKMKPLTYDYFKKHQDRVLVGLINKVKRLHNLNIIHRDIKMENILIDNDEVYLCDFEDKGYTETHAPSEVLNDLEFSLESDMYSLGCTIYELITCLQPWHNIDDFENYVSKSDFEPLLSNVKYNLYRNIIRDCLVKRCVEKKNLDLLVDAFTEPWLSRPSMS